MNKIMVAVVCLMIGSVAVKAEEFNRPINITFTNAVSAWTNNIADPVILKNVITHAGVSNENFTVSLVSLASGTTNTIIALHSNGLQTATSSAILAIPMNIGDALQFDTTYSLTNRIDGQMKSAIINTAKNK